MEFVSIHHILKPGIQIGFGIQAEGFRLLPFFQQQSISNIKSVVQIMFSVLASGVNIFKKFRPAHNKRQQADSANLSPNLLMQIRCQFYLTAVPGVSVQSVMENYFE